MEPQNFNIDTNGLIILANLGDAESQVYLGYMYSEGIDDIPKNEVQAAYWFRKSAESGLPIAQQILGMAYYEGTGVLQDYTEAAKWLIKAANQKSQDTIGSYAALGVLYEHGWGVAQSNTEAIKWYRKSAEAGIPEGKEFLNAITKNQISPVVTSPNNTGVKGGNKLQSPQVSNSSCYIATAAYGSPYAKEVDAFRYFRDTVLVKSWFGRIFIAFYYKTSPPLANFIAEREYLKVATRKWILAPLLHFLRKK